MDQPRETVFWRMLFVWWSGGVVMSITYLVSPSPSVVIFVTGAIMYDIVPCIHSEQSRASLSPNTQIIQVSSLAGPTRLVIY